MANISQLRRNARKLALQALYQWQFNEAPAEELLPSFLAHDKANKADVEYFKALVEGVIKSKTELDALLRPQWDRALEDLDPVELSLLRYALFELKERLDVPY